MSLPTLAQSPNCSHSVYRIAFRELEMFGRRILYMSSAGDESKPLDELYFDVTGHSDDQPLLCASRLIADKRS
jgi:hypothetical protein